MSCRTILSSPKRQPHDIPIQIVCVRARDKIRYVGVQRTVDENDGIVLHHVPI